MSFELQRSLKRAENYYEIVNLILSYKQISYFFENQKDKLNWIIANSEKMDDDFGRTSYGRNLYIPEKELKKYLKIYYIDRPFKTFPDILKFYQKNPDSEDPPKIAQYLREELLKLIQDLKERIEDTYDFGLLADVNLELHHKIKEISLELFRNKHYAQAVFESAKALNNYVKEKAGITDRDLSDTMTRIFNENNPIIKLNDLATRSDKDEQEGFRFLYMGAMKGIRNPKAHDNIKQEDKNRTLEYLAFLSLLFRRAEEGKVEKNNNKS